MKTVAISTLVVLGALGLWQVVASGRVTAQYQRTDSSQHPLVLNLALLGTGLQSKIIAGENRGRTLKQEFVVLRHVTMQSPDAHWQLPLPSVEKVNAKRLALAVWVSRVGDQVPLQATGGWISRAMSTRLVLPAPGGSSHRTTVPRQTPETQVSNQVQGSPSSQLMEPTGSYSHPPSTQVPEGM